MVEGTVRSRYLSVISLWRASGRDRFEVCLRGYVLVVLYCTRTVLYTLLAAGLNLSSRGAKREVGIALIRLLLAFSQ